MAINHTDGTFAIYLFEDLRGLGEPADVEFAESVEQLRERARVLVKAGRFKYIWLGRSDEIDDSKFIDEFFYEAPTA